MLASQSMDHQLEETPAALQRLWSLTRARLAGTSTALDEMPELVETLPSAQVTHDLPTFYLFSLSVGPSSFSFNFVLNLVLIFYIPRLCDVNVLSR